MFIYEVIVVAKTHLILMLSMFTPTSIFWFNCSSHCIHKFAYICHTFWGMKIFPKSTHTHGKTFPCLLTQMQTEGRQAAAHPHSPSNGFILLAFWSFSLSEQINYLYTVKWLPADAVHYFICHHYNHIIQFKECWKINFVSLVREKHEKKRTTK